MGSISALTEIESPEAGGGRIRLLDPHTINQIAAGEVVERPASVVKELVENALDAGANAICVELQDSGRRRIKVSDDGCGMSPGDAAAALMRHATSKIRIADDLLEVWTLGFRGEALPSIASVSRMTLSSGEEDGLRHVIEVEGGAVRSQGQASGPRGTEITVEDLFFNTPARLKFLRSDTTELAACLDHLCRLAIGYPAVSFKVAHNGQEAFATSGSGDTLQTIGEAWGWELSRAMAEICAPGSGMTVRGYVSPPHVTRPTRAYQIVFVNGRPIRSRTLTAAVDQAFRDLTPDRRYPLLALFLEVEPSKVDVNVSPTKSEVRFHSEGQAFEAVRFAIRAALMEHGMMPPAGAIAAANEALVLSSEPVPPPAGPLLPGLAVAGAHTAIGSPSRLPFASLADGLRVLGQAMDTFIIAETSHGIAVIDQHVAHERVLYEQLCEVRGQCAVERQALLAPETLHLDRRAAILLRDRLDEIARVGFDIEPFGGESFIVRSSPAALRGRDPLKVLRDLADELVESAASRHITPTREQIWITTACKMAVKAGDSLTRAEMEKLVVDLAATENPYLCPHGRPITITLATSDLMRMFKRA